MAFKDKFPITTKVIIDNCIWEQVSHFIYLGNEITYMQKMYILIHWAVCVLHWEGLWKAKQEK